jgi:hypothetical protein
MRISLGATQHPRVHALTRTIQGWAALGTVVMSACASSTTVPDSTCSSPPGHAGPPEAEQLARLAGEYRLVLVNTRGEYGDSVVRGTLTLWPNDSARRYAWVHPVLGRFPGERPLAGRFTSHSGTVPSHPSAWERATADHPAVELIGSTLFLGGIDMMDGSGERLDIRTAALDGFAGTWGHDGGIGRLLDTVNKRFLKDPGGHFCAWRTG